MGSNIGRQGSLLRFLSSLVVALARCTTGSGLACGLGSSWREHGYVALCTTTGVASALRFLSTLSALPCRPCPSLGLTISRVPRRPLRPSRAPWAPAGSLSTPPILLAALHEPFGFWGGAGEGRGVGRVLVPASPPAGTLSCWQAGCEAFGLGLSSILSCKVGAWI